MISGPLAPDLSAPPPTTHRPGSPRLSPRALGLLGLALVGCGVVGLVAWGIFVSPLGFARYPLAERDRTFTIHQAGTYVVYFEHPGESRAALPPALDIHAAALTGQTVEVRPLGTSGVKGAPDAYDLAGHEGRAVALIVVREPGTILVTIEPTAADKVDASQERVVVEGTIALGREWSRSWLASWMGIFVVVIAPVLGGCTLMVMAWRRSRDQATDR